MLNEHKNYEEQLWIGVAISRPGKHNYIIRYEDDIPKEDATS
jgi:hypothetical protein